MPQIVFLKPPEFPPELSKVMEEARRYIDELYDLTLFERNIEAYENDLRRHGICISRVSEAGTERIDPADFRMSE